MSNIYLEVTIEKTQNFDFLSLESSSQGQLLGSSNSLKYHWIFKLLFETQKSEIWEQNCMVLLSFLFWKELRRFKVKEMVFVEQKYKL